MAKFHIASTAIERGFPSCFQKGPYVPESPKNKKVSDLKFLPTGLTKTWTL
jgi:hypothetical protein